MTLTAHHATAVEAMCGAGIGEHWGAVRAAYEQWFARTSSSGLDLSIEDRKWPERLRWQSGTLLTHWGLDGLVGGANTVLTEMVNNALVHGGGGNIGVRITLMGGGVKIEVADSSSAPARLVRAAPNDEGGRGLFLVHAFSDSWGTRARRRGKWTWAFLATPGAEGVR